MIKLFPGDDEAAIDPRAAVAAEERPAEPDRPWLFTNMIASADGGTAVDGVSGDLGGPGDKTMFGALRGVADIILVGAATVREEAYRAPTTNEETAAARVARGQAARPRLAIVSRSLDIDLDLPLFDDPENRPYVLTAAAAPSERVDRLSGLAEVLVVGDDGVDLGTALAALRQRGAEKVLSEGGPSINGQLIAADLVDEWNLSVSPVLLGADSRRAAIGPLPAGPPVGMRLTRVWADDSFLFCRWIRR